LYPYRPLVRTTTAATTTTTRNKKQVNIIRATEHAKPSPLVVTTTTKTLGVDALTVSKRKTRGLQCSPTCGCVVRFEAEEALSSAKMDGTSSTSSYHLTYMAKNVVSVTHTTGPHAGTRRALLTAKGRPMLQECTCTSLHSLASALVDYYNQHHRRNGNGGRMVWEKLRADLEFESLRSSRAFQQSVLRAQGLGPQAAPCFDVVEEAWTAMVKGHLLQSRSRAVGDCNGGKRSVLPSLTTTTEEEMEHPDFLTPSPVLSWVDEDYDERQQKKEKFTTTLSMSSTLDMFDRNQQLLQQQQQVQKKRRRTMDGLSNPPSDWLSYVDELYKYGQDKRSA